MIRLRLIWRILTGRVPAGGHTARVPDCSILLGGHVLHHRFEDDPACRPRGGSVVKSAARTVVVQLEGGGQSNG